MQGPRGFADCLGPDPARMAPGGEDWAELQSPVSMVTTVQEGDING